MIRNSFDRPNFFFFCLRKKNFGRSLRQISYPLICSLYVNSQGQARWKSAAGSTIRVSHVGSRNVATCAVTKCLPGYNPGSSRMWASASIGRTHQVSTPGAIVRNQENEMLQAWHTSVLFINEYWYTSVWSRTEVKMLPLRIYMNGIWHCYTVIICSFLRWNSICMPVWVLHLADYLFFNKFSFFSDTWFLISY